MNAWLLAWHGMRHYWRTNLGVVLGVVCATTVLVGALSVGDSVRLSLRDQALHRVGQFSAALAAGDRFVTADLANRIATELGGAVCIPTLQLPGVAASQGGKTRTGIVDVFGIEDGFFAMSSTQQARKAPAAGHALINNRLASQLGCAVGDEIVVRVEKPSLMPIEATMATVDEVSFALRVTIDGIVAEAEFGRFGLRSSQVPPFNVFLSLAWLQQELQLPGRANLLLSNASVAKSDAALQTTWQLRDAELQLRTDAATRQLELTSSRVFLDETIVTAVRELAPEAIGVVTYFVNSLSNGAATTPYSMVSAIGPLTAAATTPTELHELQNLAPAAMSADQIVCNSWLAEDLAAKVGDTIELRYTVMNQALQFEERSHRLQVHSIVPLAGAAADASLMPAFPGLAEAKSCRDWEPGIPVDLQQLDDEDQQYWEQYKGTPKAFVKLSTGQALWQNRFGTLTAIRMSMDRAEQLERRLPRLVDPKSINLYFQDLRGPAQRAGVPATDFGSLYLGLSFFLIVAALLLAAMMFAFGVEQRSREIGTLLAVGYERRVVRWLFLREALLLATVGASIGAVGGVAYTHFVLYALDTLWRDTIGQTNLVAHIVPGSVAVGAFAAVLAALLAIVFTLRREFAKSAVELLSNKSGDTVPATSHQLPSMRRWLRPMCMLLCLLGAGYLVLTADPMKATSAFFLGGTLLLVSGLFACRGLLARIAIPDQASSQAPIASIAALSRRNTGRRPGRSLATLALLASGTFLVVAIQANRLTPPADATLRSSGTGGFALFGRSTLPVLRDLASAAGRDAYGLDQDQLQDVAIVPLRVRAGDDASCLNLSTAQNPQLVAVSPQAFAERECFRFTRSLAAADRTTSKWLLLDEEFASDDFGKDVVPAIGDGGSVAWALHKKLGDTLQYRDEAGNAFAVRIVGTVADSILQGNLVISDRHMRERFPSASGYRMFLIDAPAKRCEQVQDDLTRALQDIGLELTPTATRLAQFQAVQNTYLTIFQLLGGLGLLLGTAGLGVVVLRNALERRSELAIARAIGFSNQAVRNLLGWEHALLLLLGLGLGVAAASFAIWPAMHGSNTLPLWSIITLLAGLVASGMFWVWLASAIATRGKLLDSLRDE